MCVSIAQARAKCASRSWDRFSKCVLSCVCCVLSYLCSHMCALICLLSNVFSHMCALLCVISYVCFHMCALICVLLLSSHICALICVLSSVLSSVCSHDAVSLSQFHPKHCLGSLAGIFFFGFLFFKDTSQIFQSTVPKGSLCAFIVGAHGCNDHVRQ